MSAEIRPVTTDQITIIARLAKEIWYAHYPGIISHAQIAYMLEQGYSKEALMADLDRGVEMNILWYGDEPVGFSAFEQVDGDQVKLHKCYLAQSFHGRGLGSTLIRHCEAWARENGAKTLRLNVNKQNQEAIAAYRRNGFSHAESVCDDIGQGFYMDDFVMAKVL